MLMSRRQNAGQKRNIKTNHSNMCRSSSIWERH